MPYLGESKTEIQYAGEMLILAESLDEPEAVATALGALGTGYLTLGAYRGGVILLESAAGISREHDLPFPLARALNNLAAFLNGRDLAAALRHAQECAEVARRAGLEGSVENAMVNYAIGLWCAGRLVELAEIIPSGLKATQPGMAFTWWALDVWLADAAGTSPPPPLDEPDTDAQSDLAWRTSGDLSRALTAGDPAEVARLAPVVLSHTMAAAGIDDDFFVLWPPLVLAALSIGDLDLAERLMAPVAIALPGRRPPAVTAQWHRLRGLLAAARSDDPRSVEAAMRAGVDALAAFGAVGFHAQAQEELGRWLAAQDRADEAGPCWRLPVRRTSRSAPPAGSPGSTRIRPPRSNRRLRPRCPDGCQHADRGEDRLECGDRPWSCSGLDEQAELTRWAAPGRPALRSGRRGTSMPARPSRERPPRQRRR